MSDYEYDNLFDELKKLELETGFVMANSPTQFVGYEVKSKLNKVKHNHPMLSLDKTKNVQDLIEFAGNKDCLLMLKLDGLTVSVEYEYTDGILTRAETRGDGETGEDILHNASVFINLPNQINHKGKLIVDGEAIITYENFEKINASLPDDEKYKNPRNLVSGSVRQLDSEITSKRSVQFIAWKCIEGIDNNSHDYQLSKLESLGFDVVPHTLVSNKYQSKQNIEYLIANFKRLAEEKGYPIDGMVFGYDDIAYGESLGATGHHLRSQIAFKFYDEEVTTILRDVEWSMGKTGSLNPVAIFDSVEIDGTTVSRASLHNVSICEDLQLGIGDEITVYKANSIIPQIRESLTKGNNITIPSTCPICGEPTEIVKENDTKVLMCNNNRCKGKLLGRFSNFVSKPAMNIDGLSEATLEKFIEKGWLKSFSDIYTLDTHKDELIKMNGFGKKSWDKLWTGIQNSKNVNMKNFIVSIGIPNIGKTASKSISNYFNGSLFDFEKAILDEFDFTILDDFGQTMNDSIYRWYNNPTENAMWNKLTYILNFNSNKETKAENMNTKFTGKIVVVTGSLNHFTRTEIQEKLEQVGAKVSGSISKKTNYLIVGENAGSKLSKAQDLGVNIITEDDFLTMIGGD